MQRADTGSVVVTDDGKVVGILTERDLLRAAAGEGDPDRERVRLWMTARPDVLGPDERVDAAWASLTSHHYRHLPVVEGDRCVGVVSLRDLMAVARIRPAAETSGDVPAGLEGVVVAETTIGDVRGQGGLLPLPPVLGGRAGRDSARSRTSGICSSGASCPTPRPSAAFGDEVRRRRAAAARACSTVLPALCAPGRAARRAAHRRLAARRRAGVAARRTTSGPTSSTTRRSGCARSCRRSWRPPTACGRGRSPWSRATTSASPPTTSSC